MKEFIEKLIGRLEEYKYSHLIERNSEQCEHCKDVEDCENMDCSLCIWDKAIEIVNQLAEEYKLLENIEQLNNGWIPCSERLPNLFDTVIVTTKDGETWFGHWDGQGFEDDGTEYFHTLKVIAWQPLPEPYNPKGE